VVAIGTLGAAVVDVCVCVVAGFVFAQMKTIVAFSDPSSMKSGGSILGDVTRMDKLTKSPNAYVRGSPTRGVLGGIGEHTNDVVLLCEGAGYDCVIVESVGLGQSEVSIDQAVDLLILLVGSCFLPKFWCTCCSPRVDEVRFRTVAGATGGRR
jgi:putative protein kinase ArgK-like GTPase of G3E family